MSRRPLLFALFSSVACGPAGESRLPVRPPVATQWLNRAEASYRAADFDDARDATRQGLTASPQDAELRVLAARIALVGLDYTEALRLTEGLESADARSIRGHAYWFSGDLEHAADELDALLADPAVKDPWARDVAGLARRGVGRHPFSIEGGILGAVDMPRAIERVALGAANVVPCELDGERILALVSTGSSEVILDSNSRREPSWVSLRFDRLEFNDVPALVQDLAPISHQLGVPIQAMLGVQFLRHAHVTFDRHGDQFVVRRQEATPPPEASRVPLYYLRGGGMILRATVTARNDAPIPLFVDSSRQVPLVLQDDGWKSAGVDLGSLVAVPEDAHLKRGTVPIFRMGGFDLAKLPALGGVDFAELTSGLDVHLAGLVGADLLAFFRVTFADDGRFIWIEPDPTLLAPEPKPIPAAAVAPKGPAAQ